MIRGDSLKIYRKSAVILEFFITFKSNIECLFGAMTQNFKSNTDLVENLKKGNEDAYADLIDFFNHKLCIYANSLVNDGPLAEDIVQNVFIRVWEKRANLKPDFSIKSYLYK